MKLEWIDVVYHFFFHDYGDWILNNWHKPASFGLRDQYRICKVCKHTQSRWI